MENEEQNTEKTFAELAMELAKLNGYLEGWKDAMKAYRMYNERSQKGAQQ